MSRHFTIFVACAAVVAAGSIALADAPAEEPEAGSPAALQAAIDDNALAIRDLQEQIDTVALQLETGSVGFPGFSGTRCEIGTFSRTYVYPPNVYVSINHNPHQPPATHDPVTVWIEQITQNLFRVCVREVDADNVHDAHVVVDWLAIQ